VKMHWDGETCEHPATGLRIHAGEAEYPDEAAEALQALGLKPADEPAAPAPRRKTKGGEE
jgi:hypothetical protein